MLDSFPGDVRLPPGWQLVYSPSTGSTNDDAKAAARRGNAHRTVFLADSQTAGRGRFGRAWIAPAASCLLFSVVLDGAPSPIYSTAAASVAVAETIGSDFGIAARIKWPNDVMIEARKVCGVLTEVVSSGGLTATVIGIGLNVNFSRGTEGLPPTATSLSWEMNHSLSRADLFSAILGRLDGLLGLPGDKLVSVVQERWEHLLWHRSQEVRLADGDAVLEGVVLGLASSGGLFLKLKDGSQREILNGELLLS
jgi:BirA family transcriptional regulator, biotin operon repressor / biotin---[acetyl-CoA-carboxylase] ligase